MDQYNELYVRAQRTADQERQRLDKALNNQDNAAVHSDSELSTLASSMFNSIDSI
jgi:hypothetical protein